MAGRDAEPGVPFVDLLAQYQAIRAEVDRAVAEVVAQSAFIRGPIVERFEADWARTLGVRHCVSCANGTDALYIAMKALGVQPGDEVITTAHSWISTSETITQAGGRVVFVDTDADTFTLDPAGIEARITPRTVGLIPVHLYGQPADMGPILEIARRRGLWVLEDCAQAHLARDHGRLAGTFGRIATFSFYPGKNLGAWGDAGCIVTDDDALASWMACYARHGGKGEHRMEGVNSRMDGLQAAVLGVKLGHLSAWNRARQRLAARYGERLRGCGDVVLPVVAPGREHVYHLYVIRTARRDALMEHLSARGIATSLNYPRALPFYPAYAHLGHAPADFPNAFANQSRILSLPMYPEMTDAQQDRVVRAIQEFFA